MKTAATKIILLLTAVIFLSAGIVARNKSVSVKPFTGSGVWNGSLGMLINNPDEYFGMVLEENGSMKRINNNGNTIATGNWAIRANRFNGHYSFTDGSGKVSISGAVDPIHRTINGTWKNDGDNSGTWKVIQSKF